MKIKKLASVFFLILAGLAFFWLVFQGCNANEGGREPTGTDPILMSREAKNPVEQPAGQKGKSKVILYLFHGSRRCFSCNQMEEFSRSTLDKYFQIELKSGQLEFKPVNVEKPENQHFIEDFQLYSISLIMAKYQGNKQTAWKNLNYLGPYLNSLDRFAPALKAEIEKF